MYEFALHEWISLYCSVILARCSNKKSLLCKGHLDENWACCIVSLIIFSWWQEWWRKKETKMCTALYNEQWRQKCSLAKIWAWNIMLALCFLFSLFVCLFFQFCCMFGNLLLWSSRGFFVCFLYSGVGILLFDYLHLNKIATNKLNQYLNIK